MDGRVGDRLTVCCHGKGYLHDIEGELDDQMRCMKVTPGVDTLCYTKTVILKSQIHFSNLGIYISYFENNFILKKTYVMEKTYIAHAIYKFKQDENYELLE